MFQLSCSFLISASPHPSELLVPLCLMFKLNPAAGLVWYEAKPVSWDYKQDRLMSRRSEPQLTSRLAAAEAYASSSLEWPCNGSQSPQTPYPSHTEHDRWSTVLLHQSCAVRMCFKSCSKGCKPCFPYKDFLPKLCWTIMAAEAFLQSSLCHQLFSWQMTGQTDDPSVHQHLILSSGPTLI